MVRYISERFHENTLNSFQLIERTGVHGGNDYVQCSNNSKSSQSELCVLQCRLVMLDICVKFRENIMNGIRVMERTRVHGKIAIFNIYNVQRVVTPNVG